MDGNPWLTVPEGPGDLADAKTEFSVRCSGSWLKCLKDCTIGGLYHWSDCTIGATGVAGGSRFNPLIDVRMSGGQIEGRAGAVLSCLPASQRTVQRLKYLHTLPNGRGVERIDAIVPLCDVTVGQGMLSQSSGRE